MSVVLEIPPHLGNETPEQLEKQFETAYATKAELEAKIAAREELGDLSPDLAKGEFIATVDRAVELLRESLMIGQDDPFNILNPIQRYFNSEIDRIPGYLSTRWQSIEIAKEELEGTLNHIAELEAKLEKLNATEQPKLTLASVREQLASIPSIEPRSVLLKKHCDVYWVSWTYSGLKYRPNHNPFSNIENGSIPTIPVPRCRTAICLTGDSKGTVEIFPHDSVKREELTDYWVEDTVHPHILEDAKPCFGDFESGVIEAIHEEIPDIQTIAAIIEMFLSQADTDDSAGKRWVNYYMQRMGQPFADVDRLPQCSMNFGRVECQGHFIGEYQLHIDEATGEVTSTFISRVGGGSTENQQVSIDECFADHLHKQFHDFHPGETEMREALAYLYEGFSYGPETWSQRYSELLSDCIADDLRVPIHTASIRAELFWQAKDRGLLPEELETEILEYLPEPGQDNKVIVKEDALLSEDNLGDPLPGRYFASAVRMRATNTPIFNPEWLEVRTDTDIVSPAEAQIRERFGVTGIVPNDSLAGDVNEPDSST